MISQTKVNINAKARALHTYDAIVIGSGISGGWAAKELCESGLKTIVLERGRNIEHLKDYPTMTKAPWELEHRGRMSYQFYKDNPLISKAAGFGEDTSHFFIKDDDHPYVQEKPFDWIRGYQVGGKSIIWGRACQRWSNYEFEAPVKLGYGHDWPIRYDDIAPWYSHAEKFMAYVATRMEWIQCPTGNFCRRIEFNCVEKHLKESYLKKYTNRFYVQGRWAHLSEPSELHKKQGRGRCQARNLCMRGCPYGAYFSSVSTTLPWAMKTGNLTVRPFSVVHSIIYDEAIGQASGVRVIDANTKEVAEYFAKVFCQRVCIKYVLVLLNSTVNVFLTVWVMIVVCWAKVLLFTSIADSSAQLWTDLETSITMCEIQRKALLRITGIWENLILIM